MKNTCTYTLRFGDSCGRTCLQGSTTFGQSERCKIHWNSRERLPCKVCNALTSAKPGLCRKHSGNYYVKQYFKKMHEKAIAYDQHTAPQKKC